MLKRRRPFEFWQSVTGSLESGESARDTAVRELSEETGLTSSGQLIDTGRIRRFEIDPRWRNRYADDVRINTEFEWRYRLKNAQPITICDSEHSEFRWFDVSKAIDTVWSWTNREALEELRIELE